MTKYIMDFLDPPRERSPIETRPYQADSGTRESYIYQQTMLKNKEMFPWVLHSLDVPLMPPKVQKPHYLLVKEPINIPYDSVEQLEDPRLNNYSPRSSISVSHYNDSISELDAMLHKEHETEDEILPEETTSTVKNSIHDTPLEVPEEETLASDWIILDIIGTIDNDFE